MVNCSVTSALSFLKMQGCLHVSVSSMFDRAKAVKLIFARVFCWTTPARAAKPLFSGAKGQLKLRLLGSFTVFDIWRRGGVSSTLSMTRGYLLDRWPDACCNGANTVPTCLGLGDTAECPVKLQVLSVEPAA